MNILGFDPGYARLGWAVLSTSKSSSKLAAETSQNDKKTNIYISDLNLLECGLIETSFNDKDSTRFNILYEQISSLIQKFNPSLIAFESLFFNTNKKTAQGVYRTQGILLALAGKTDCPVMEIAPTAIKKTITQNGNASKKDIMNMIERLLSLKKSIKQDDTADAVSCALAAFMKYKSQKILSNRIQTI